ncbi:MAG TPA: hypothetical protein VM943_08100 [Pyrinomonadaceae bacterium]|nr:hypothetical protein [Pyrinomonadaceae bacterium]
MSQMLELPDEVFNKLLTEAKRTGMSPVDWISEKLTKTSRATLSEQERQDANARLERHIVSLGYPTGTDNRAIDDDLVKEFGGER